MNIVVCVKRVPMTQEVDLEVDAAATDVKREAMDYLINDWDNYAVEEAVSIREERGGTVTAVTVGGEDDEDVLRRALAMGADRAVRIDPGDQVLDGYVTSRLLAAALKGLNCDLILTGVQAEDDNWGVVGPMLAEHLGLAPTAVVTGLEIGDRDAVVTIELEEGVNEVCRVRLPALFTVQTGINEPRYVSIMGIRKAGKKDLKVVTAGELGLSGDELTPGTVVEEVYLPPEAEGAEMLEGSAAEAAEHILRIIREKGGSV
jgi:electron transfer flavoprotein beta subunit